MQAIKDIATLQHLLEHEQQLRIYKFNSNHCTISTRTKKEVEQSEEDYHINVYLIDIIQHQDISTYMTTYSGIQHESPQLLYMVQRKVQAHTSHMHISSERVQQQL